jgi:divalent metal cation (Fe/Co/Zn/Cd) transporter
VVAVDGLSNLTRAFWILVVGAVALYAFFLVMGAMTPADHPLLAAGVVVLGLLLVVHLFRVRRAMHDHAHDDEMRELHKLRETRGF